MTDENFLSRWSRRKSEAKVEAAPPPVAESPPDAPPAPSPAPVQAAEALPPVESLTFDSDFAAFMQPGVDPGLRREALKTLLKDPRFNVMDGLDVYIDDYSKPDPIPEGWLERMYQSNRPNMLMQAGESPPAAPRPGEEVAAKDVPEQPVEPPAAIEGSDTSSAQVSPPQVGKSPVPADGDPDVLV